jgi:class 3 adenylate cyclase
VIGNTTNLAARLQGLTRQLDASIAVDANTRAAAGAACRGFLIHADVRIRGRTNPVDIFALPLRGEDIREPKLSAVS